MSESKKLRLEDLKLGMTIYESQLREIYDTYVILGNTSFTDNNDIKGTIIYIGSTLNDNVQELRSKYSPITSVYNNLSEIGDEVYYEE